MKHIFEQINKGDKNQKELKVLHHTLGSLIVQSHKTNLNLHSVKEEKHQRLCSKSLLIL